jgi:uncharacterized membrane protein (UPF0182 family)
VTINGPVQVQGQIEADSAISQKLTLWRGAGSETIEGNLLTLPVAGGLLYIEPYYVRAKTDSGYPLLQGVAAAFGEKVALGDSLRDALDKVFGTGAGTSAAGAGTGGGGAAGVGGGAGAAGGASRDILDAAADARRAYQAGQTALGKTPPDWAGFGKAQSDLSNALGRLGRLTSPAPSPSPPASPPAAAGSPSPSASERPRTGPSAAASAGAPYPTDR